MDLSGYAALFGPDAIALDEETWIARANQSLTPCLAALTARFERGSRAEKTLDVSYEPGQAARNFVGVSGGGIAEMLDQAATHCGTFVTGLACPTVSMNVSFFRAATAKRYIAHARVVKLTRALAFLGADLKDDAGRHIASVSVVAQLVELPKPQP